MERIPNTLTIDKTMIDAIAYQTIKNTIEKGTDRVKQEYMLHQTVGVIVLAESMKRLLELANETKTEPDAEKMEGNGNTSGDGQEDKE